jgi:hypothetical protein
MIEATESGVNQAHAASNCPDMRSSILEQPQIPVGAFLGLCPFSAAARGERAAGADAGENQLLLVQRQVEQAEDDAVDQEIQFGSAGAVGRCPPAAAARDSL